MSSHNITATRKNIIVDSRPTSISPPSATSYMAFLRSMKVDDKVYALSDRSVAGSRPPFLPLRDDLLSVKMVQERHERTLQATAIGGPHSFAGATVDTIANQTDCTILATAVECVQSDIPCQ